MIRNLLLLLIAALWASPIAAQSFPVDDSASHVLEAGPIKMRWNTLVPQPGQASTMTGQVVVLVRLDVSPWRGRRARIYQTLPSQPIGPVDVRWTANGPLLPGALRDGGRTLVYAGPIQSDRLEDTFRITIQADGNRVLRPQDLTFAFEIELESP
ncbi:MAG: hypothetical protein J0M09_14435 [Xanthomonadales bacterium]|jgi:hypothetical protein|nr:hypothetical protein [Xanthomonadales bacterium]